jgi:hypothetical protein
MKSISNCQVHANGNAPGAPPRPHKGRRGGRGATIAALGLVCIPACGSSKHGSSELTQSGLSEQTLLFGNASIASVPDNIIAGQAEGFQFTALSSGTLQVLNLYVDSPNAAPTIDVGVYDATGNGGSPGNRLATCTLQAPMAGAWNACSITSGPTITGGQVVWVAVLGPAGGGSPAYRDEHGGRNYDTNATTLTSLPSPYNAGPSWASSQLSVQGLGAPAGTGADAGPDACLAVSTSASLFTNQTPALLHNIDGANVNYELGTKLRSSAAGNITAIRFWKDSLESGTHTGHIWSASGSLLASVVFANETASGWQQQALPAPIAIAANTAFTVSVATANGYYVSTNDGLASSVTNAALSSIVGNNGTYGPPGQYPTQTWIASNYFRDVVFTTTSSCSAGNDAGTGSDAGRDATADAGSHDVVLTWTASISAGVIGYNVYRGTQSGGPYASVTASPVNATAYTDPTVKLCTTYYYVATALTGTQESVHSGETQAVIPCQ